MFESLTNYGRSDKNKHNLFKTQTKHDQIVMLSLRNPSYRNDKTRMRKSVYTVKFGMRKSVYTVKFGPVGRGLSCQQVDFVWKKKTPTNS